MKSSLCGIFSIGILLTAIVAVASADDSKDEAIKKDRNQIAGTWRIVGLVDDGIIRKNADDKQKEDAAQILTVVNGSDGTWSVRNGDKEVSKGTSTFDPTKKPKTIDFTQTEGQLNGKQFLGIYELGENTRKLCFAFSGEKRPTEFSSSPDSRHVLVIFERLKAK